MEPYKFMTEASETFWEFSRRLTPEQLRDFMQDFSQEYARYTGALAEGMAHSLLIVFHARGFPVPEDARARILAEKNRERLERWLERAAVAVFFSAAAILDGPD